MAEELVWWVLGLGYPLLLITVFVFGMSAKNYAREHERCMQEKLRLEERLYQELYQEREKLEELKRWLKALHQEHNMIREDIDNLMAAIKQLHEEKCKIVEVEAESRG